MKRSWQETPFCLNVNPNTSPRPVIKDTTASAEEGTGPMSGGPSRTVPKKP